MWSDCVTGESGELRAVVLATLVACSLVGGVTVVSGTTAAAGNTAPDCSSVSYSGGGTSGNPYQVGTVAQLQCVENQGLDADYVQTQDIDASGTASWNGGSGFEPVGDTSNGFGGTFDGNGYTVSGLTIDRASTDFVGVFREVDPGGTVTNVRLDGGTVAGGERVGALVGSNNGTVSQSVATGDVTASTSDVGGLVGVNGGTVEASSATGDVTSASGNVGGLVGENDGTVANSYATGDATGDSYHSGGLVGVNFGTIADTYATGDVAIDSLYAGGLVGSTYTEIRRSYATGAVSANDDSGGGLVGRLAYTTVSNSYWDRGTTNQDQARNTEGTLSDVASFGATADTAPAPEMQGSSAETNMDGLDFTSTWETVSSGDTDATADGYPILSTLDRKAQLEAQGIYTSEIEVSSITRSSPASRETNADSVAFEVTFPETVESVSTDDFTLSGAASGTIGSVSSSSGSVITVTVTAVSGDGSLGLDLASSGDVTDTDGNALSTTEPGTDETYTIDNTAPSFSAGATNTVSKDEGTTGVVLDVDADDDSGSDYDTNVDYSLGGADAVPFSIDANTGKLSLDAPQDFESPGDGNTDGASELTVTATDDVGNSESQTATVTIDDVDETPSFTSDSSATVARSDPQTTLVQDVNANVGGDADKGVSYSITAGNADVAGDGGDAFAIDGSTGEITVNDADDVDVSSTGSFSLDVVASEGAESGTQTITVSVADGVAPTISSFDVSNPAGQDVQVTFESDERLSTIAVGISGVESETLSANDFTESGSGPYTYTATYSGSSDGSYDVALSTAADAVGNDGSQAVGSAMVTIDTTGPSFTSSATVSVPENSDATALDVDADDGSGADTGVTYALVGGPDQSAFDIDASTGVLSFASPPDYENPTDSDTNNEYVVAVDATDGVGNTNTRTITVSVTDVDESPIAPDRSQATDEDTPISVADGDGADLLKLASDPDAGDSLSVVSIDGESFSVGTPVTFDSGATVTVAADGSCRYDPDGQYDGLSGGDSVIETFTYTVADTDGDTAQGTVTVTVTGVEDPPTARAGPNRTITVATPLTLNGSASTDDSSIDAYEWDFGDGTTATGATPTRTFLTPGTYTVTLTVEDAAGNLGTDTLTVTVTGDSGGADGGGGGDSGESDDDHVTAAADGEGASASASADAGDTVQVDFGDLVRNDTAGIAVRQVDLEFDEEVDPVTVEAAPLSNSPAGVATLQVAGGSADDLVSHVELAVTSDGTDATDALDSATVRFAVSADTLNERDAATADIALYRFDDERETWERLPTEFATLRNGWAVYEATTTGFSTFAIVETSGPPAGTPTATATPDAADTSTPTSAATPATGQTATSTVTAPPTPTQPTPTATAMATATPTSSPVPADGSRGTTSGDGPGFGLVVAVITVLSGALLGRRMRR